MPFGSANTDFLPSTSFALGPTASFEEVFDASRRRQQMVDSAFGMQVNLRDAYQKQIDGLNTITGTDNSPKWDFALDAIGAGMKRKMGLPTTGLDVGTANFLGGQYLSDIDKLDAAITAGKARNPNLKTFAELYDQEVENRKALIAASDSTQERGGSFIPEFLGSMVGSLDPQRDPLFFGTIFLPFGAARGIAQKLLFEAIAAGGTQAAQQLIFTGPRAAALKEPQADLFTSVLQAATGAAILRGGLEGVPRVFRGAGTAIAEALPTTVTGKSLNLPDYIPHLSDEDLLRSVQSLPETPETSAAEAALYNDILTAKTSPLAGSREGQAQTETEVAQAAADFEAGRPMNPRSVTFKDGPDFATQVSEFARQRNPELYTQLDYLQTQLTDTETQLKQLVAAKDKIEGGEDFFANNQAGRIQQIKQEFQQGIDHINQEEAAAKANGQPEGFPSFEALREHLKRTTQTQLESEFGARAATKRLLKSEISRTYRASQKIAIALRKAGEKTQELEVKAAKKLGPAQKSVRTKRSPSPEGEQKLAENFDVEKATEVTTKTAKESLKTTVEASLKKTPAETVTRESLDKEIAKTTTGLVTMNKLGDAVMVKVRAALSDRARVIYWAEGKPHEIVDTGLTGLIDDKGKPWGLGPLLIQKLDNAARVEIIPQPAIDIGNGRTVPADLDVAGPDGLRSAAQVVKEIEDEDALLAATTNCAQPVKEGPAQ